MKATERTFQQILVSPDHYVIPVFQRYYSWDRKNWEQLWEDLLAMIAPSERNHFHFLGTIVCASEAHMPGIPPSYLVIDGQQRLMTLSILLCAIRHMAQKKMWNKLAAEVEENFLIHKFAKNGEHYKVYPRMRDRESYLNLVDKSENEVNLSQSSESLVDKAYRYFTKEIKDLSSDEETLRKLFETITTQLDFVLINLGNENPYKIFKSLNSTGAELDQSDLIRNHVFMSILVTEQDNFDDTQWSSLEKHFVKDGRVDGSDFASFFRDVLMSAGNYVRENAVYESFEAKYSLTDLKDIGPHALLRNLRHKAEQYDIIRGKVSHSNSQIEQALKGIRALNVTASYHLILALFHKREEGLLTDKELTQSLQAISSFVLRRHVCRESSRLHGSWFCTACRELDSDPLRNLIIYLQSKGWPNDEIFVSELQKMNLYTSNQKLAILEGLELAMQAKSEPVVLDNCHIEHIMPQSIVDNNNGEAWQQSLGENWRQIYDKWLHTLGNLTLVGSDYNQSMQNEPFEIKKPILAGSKVYLNEYFANPQLTTWNEDTIITRAKTLAEIAVRVWIRPTPESIISKSNELVSVQQF